MTRDPQTGPPENLRFNDICRPAKEGGGVCHASAVAVDGQAALVHGPSGSGKTRLAFGVMALGGQLVADDVVLVRGSAEGATVEAKSGAPEMIEARGVGILHAPLLAGPVPLAVVVNLAWAEPQRLPPDRWFEVGNTRVPMILAAGQPDLAPVLLHLLRFGRAV